jgi:hypothetical protein
LTPKLEKFLFTFPTPLSTLGPWPVEATVNVRCPKLRPKFTQRQRNGSGIRLLSNEVDSDEVF